MRATRRTAQSEFDFLNATLLAFINNHNFPIFGSKLDGEKMQKGRES